MPRKIWMVLLVLCVMLCVMLSVMLGGMLLGSPTRTATAQDNGVQGIYFSANVTGPTNAAWRMNLDGSNDQVIVGPLALNQLIYVEDENRFYGTALDNAIRRMSPDGTNLETLVSGLDGANSLALDLDAGKMYWIDDGSGYLLRGLEVRRANLDGSEQELIIDGDAGFGQFEDLTLDPEGGKLYVINDDEIFWANLDGSAPDVFFAAEEGVNPELLCLTIDHANDKLYWVQDGGSSGNAIYWANLDGSDAEPVVPLANFPDVNCPVIDPVAGELLWPDSDDDTIKRADLDGGNVATVLDGLDSPRQVRVAANGRLYWLQLDNTGLSIYTFDRNTPETDPQMVADDLNLLRAFEWVPALDRLFWINQTTPFMELLQLDPDEGEPELIRRAPRGIRGIALDPAAEQLYFANSSVIARVNLDGSNLEVVVEGLESAEALALDRVNGKLYWSEGGGARRIQRANLDGTQVEEVFAHSGGGTPIFIDLAVDPVSGHLYWTYYIFGGDADYTGSIWRADLDGSAPTELIAELSNPRGLDLDVAGGKLYWTEGATNRVQRANLDGSNVEDVATTGNAPGALVVDAPNDALYWGDLSGGSLLRSKLDGSDVTTLYSGPNPPYALAVIADPPDGEEPEQAIYLPILSAD